MAHPRGKNSSNRNRMPTSFTLSDEVREYLRQLSAEYGIPMTSVVEILVREKMKDLRHDVRDHSKLL